MCLIFLLNDELYVPLMKVLVSTFVSLKPLYSFLLQYFMGQ